jgi:hypothetical protein
MTYPCLKKLSPQQQQLIRFMKERKCNFPRELLHLFSMAQFVRRRLFAPIGKTITNNQYQIKNSYEEFLRRCLMKFRKIMLSQIILLGRSQPISSQDIIQFQLAKSFRDQILTISHYGTAVLLGNISAIAEMCYRLSKTPMYKEDGLIYAHGMSKVILLVEYGISLGFIDCLGLMAYFNTTTIVYNSDQQKVLKLAGQSAEAGSIYGWFALARLLKYNSDHASYHNEFDDGIDIDESDLGVRQFVRSSLSLDEQIRQTLEEYGCERCLPQFYEGKEKCRYCDFEFDVFNNYPDDNTSVPKPEQMRIVVEICYKILRENPSSHPICVDTRKILLKIYKARERLFGGSVEATDDEISRLESI